MKFSYLAIGILCSGPINAAAVARCRDFRQLEEIAATSYLSQSPHDIEFSTFDAQAYVWSYSALKEFNYLEYMPVDLREYINSASPASGMTPLGLAALCHDLPAVKELLRLGANIDASQGQIETPWGIMEAPSPILLAILGPNFISNENNETATYLKKMQANFDGAIRRIKTKFPLSNAAKTAQLQKMNQ